MNNKDDITTEVEKVELTISKSLRIGVVISAAFIIVGLAMLLITHKSGYSSNYFPTTVYGIFKGLVALKPYAIILTGLLILILTPVFRVAVSILVFLKEKDYLYVKITTFVLIVLLFSLFMGKSI